MNNFRMIDWLFKFQIKSHIHNFSSMINTDDEIRNSCDRIILECSISVAFFFDIGIKQKMYHTWYFHSLMTSTFWRQNILRHFTPSALPLLYSWSDSPIRCSAPLYSRSGSLIRSAYYFLYISFCFRFNKSVTNLTSLRQHHLQYRCQKDFGNNFDFESSESFQLQDSKFKRHWQWQP